MSLNITSRIISGVTVVDVAGRMCFLDITLRDCVKEWLEEGHRTFVLNLANVPYIDSFGLSQLVTIWTSVRNRGGYVTLLRPPEHVQELLQLTKLNTVFNISTDEADAVREAVRNASKTDLHTISVNSNLP